MGIIDNIKKILFKKESINTNQNNQNILTRKYSLHKPHKRISYDKASQILQDVTVKMCYDFLKYILSNKQYILIANENDESKEIYDFIEDMLFNLDTEMNEIVKRNTEALIFGYHIEELLFELNPDGKIVLTDTVPLDIKTLQNEPFVYDDNGDLTHIHQEYKGEVSDIPVTKVLKYTYGDFNSDYGHGILEDVRPIIQDKYNTLNWLLTFLQRSGSPAFYGKAESGPSSQGMLHAFEDIADGTAGITIGVNEDIGILESSHQGESYFNAIQYFDNQIVKRFYIGDLIMGNTTSTGSYARSNTQLEFTQLTFDGILEEIANNIQIQIINPVVKWNFGDVHLAPTIAFDKFTTGDLKQLFEILSPLMEKGTVDPENKSVQDAIALLFKKETGLQYTNDEVDLTNLNEEFDLPPNPYDTTTEEILTNLEGVDGGTLTEDILNEVT